MKWRIQCPARSDRGLGFTLLELAVSLGVIAILAAILTPLVSNMIDDARVTRAEQEAQTLASAMLSFRQNTGRWPIFQVGFPITGTTPIFTVLIGPGADPNPPGSPWLPALPTRGDIDGILGSKHPRIQDQRAFPMAWSLRQPGRDRPVG